MNARRTMCAACLSPTSNLADHIRTCPDYRPADDLAALIAEDELTAMTAEEFAATLPADAAAEYLRGAQ